MEKLLGETTTTPLESTPNIIPESLLDRKW
jgi:hypothetical protein